MPTITIFDLEYTAWECSMARHWLGPGEFKEVVQIGAVKLDADTLGIVDEFEILVRPRINPLLSPYFEKLTGITSEKVARQGEDFAGAYARFAAFAGEGPIAAFGRDERVLEQNLRLYGIAGARPLPPFYDLRGWFAALGLDPRGLHSCDLAPALGVPFVGRTHNALDDARAIAAAKHGGHGRAWTQRPAPRRREGCPCPKPTGLIALLDLMPHPEGEAISRETFRDGEGLRARRIPPRSIFCLKVARFRAGIGSMPPKSGTSMAARRWS